jgi:hypothetical protein
MAEETRESVLQAGEYVVDYAEILQASGSGIDVRNQIDSITIFEDIFSTFITGKLTFRDTQDLPNWLGRGGRDLLRLSIGTPGIDTKYKISGYFFIYKMGDRELVKDRTQMYNMYFMSVEGLTDIQTFISKSFRGTSDKIMQQICKDYLKTEKNVVTEESKEPHRFVSNFWVPSKIANYCAQHARNPDNDSTFLFYENRDGFMFNTIGSMAKQNVIQVFEESDFTNEVTTQRSNQVYFGEVDRNPNLDYKVIQSMKIDVSWDFMRAYSGGAIKSKQVSVDLLTKRYRLNDYKADSKRKLNENSLFRPDVIDSMLPTRLLMYKEYSVTDFGNSTNSEYFQQRISELKLLDGSTVEIEAFGRSDYTVGKKVYLNTNISAPISMEDSSSSFDDLNRSGFYIITAIVHRFTRKEHMVTIELSKESTRNS